MQSVIEYQKVYKVATRTITNFSTLYYPPLADITQYDNVNIKFTGTIVNANIIKFEQPSYDMCFYLGKSNDGTRLPIIRFENLLISSTINISLTIQLIKNLSALKGDSAINPYNIIYSPSNFDDSASFPDYIPAENVTSFGIGKLLIDANFTGSLTQTIYGIKYEG